MIRPNHYLLNTRSEYRTDDLQVCALSLGLVRGRDPPGLDAWGLAPHWDPDPSILPHPLSCRLAARYHRVARQPVGQRAIQRRQPMEAATTKCFKATRK